MNKTLKIIIIVVAVFALGALLIAMMGGDDNDTNNEDTSTSESTSSSESSGEVEGSTPISYTGSGFSPESVAVSAGSKITITNDSDAVVEPSSDPHPTHTNNPELNFGDIEPGTSKTITLTKTGDWGYHNHYNSSQHATITVQ